MLEFRLFLAHPVDIRGGRELEYFLTRRAEF